MATTTTTNPLWDIQKPYVPETLTSASDIYHGRGTPQTGTSPITATGYNKALEAASGPVADLAGTYAAQLQGIASGTDPYTQRLAQQAAGAQAGLAAGQGTLGSLRATQAGQGAAADVIAKRQLDALKQIPAAQLAAQQESNIYRNVGTEQQNAAFDWLSRYRNALGLPGSSTPSTTTTRNPSGLETLIGLGSIFGSFFAEGGEVPGYANGGDTGQTGGTSRWEWDYSVTPPRLVQVTTPYNPTTTPYNPAAAPAPTQTTTALQPTGGNEDRVTPINSLTPDTGELRSAHKTGFPGSIGRGLDAIGNYNIEHQRDKRGEGGVGLTLNGQPITIHKGTFGGLVISGNTGGVSHHEIIKAARERGYLTGIDEAADVPIPTSSPVRTGGEGTGYIPAEIPTQTTTVTPDPVVHSPAPSGGGNGGNDNPPPSAGREYPVSDFANKSGRDPYSGSSGGFAGARALGGEIGYALGGVVTKRMWG